MTPEEKIEAYEYIGEILGYKYTPEVISHSSMKKRWGPRTPGNGRYPGHGIVRIFSRNSVHVALYSPKIYGIYSNVFQAVNTIAKAVYDSINMNNGLP